MKLSIVKLLFCILGLEIFSIAPSKAAEKRIILTATEDTAISIAVGHSRAKITFHPNRIESPVVKEERACSSCGVEAGFLKSMAISVNDRSVFVPRSAFADLVNLREATVRNDGGTFILTLSGGDGADSYYAQIFFDGEGVNRKKLFSALDSDKQTEEIRYWHRILKDE